MKAQTTSIPAVPALPLTSGRYQIRSPYVKFIDGVIHYETESATDRIAIKDWYLPATIGSPTITAFTDHPLYVDSLLALIDLTIERSDSGRPNISTIRGRSATFIRLIDWLRSRGIYRLKDSSRNDILELLKSIAKSGWLGALQYPSRWESALATMPVDEVRSGIHFSGKPAVPSHIKPKFWSRILGWGADHVLPDSAREKIEDHFGLGDDKWIRRRAYASHPLSEVSLREEINICNLLFDLSTNLDRLHFRTTNDVAQLVESIVCKRSERIPNLSLENATIIYSEAVTMLYKVAPILLKALQIFSDLKCTEAKKKLLENFLRTSEVSQLEELLDQKMTGLNGKGLRLREGTTNLDVVIGKVQAGCAIIIGGLTARRPGEICHKRFGIRVGDLIRPEGETQVARATFYIEKNYKDRHIFFIPRIVMDAFECLEAIQVATLPADAPSPSPGLSLFYGYRPALAKTKLVKNHFVFSRQTNAARSPTQFLRSCFNKEDITGIFEPRMLRRFYALLNENRYDHPDLRSVSQTLRHIRMATTGIYRSDTAFIDPEHGISERIGKENLKKIDDAALHAALSKEFADIQKEVDIAAYEKLGKTIFSILNGGEVAGAFTKFVQKAYAIFLQQTEFRLMGREEQSDTLRDSLHKKGFRIEPMFHGQCHANPDGTKRSSLTPRCSKNGSINRREASPKTCRSCPYHYTDVNYLKNIEAYLGELDRDRNDYMLSPLQQGKAATDYANLAEIIRIIQGEIDRNRRQTIWLTEGRHS